ncbi:succinate--CoA ligase subunit alpha [Archaeoglobus fulgidus]|uniref:Succinate--CoA ligase [ADP-forming] subunit alpha 2 n=2 Tax=Archaeoglobus fulgidus TaxID=2234 RepID=SUCD2_ARCFU|nr:succinate--CoA ligase subunit alpha [Archaeoglobus fulgidus]O28098.1 RecName: Full=Succinate--CoA ligase [ADP-forming] subunit alpha 2; AltName: Full=Succinyl-CoA synthetase subunit alpha 2; Short=SCS-alpha 2 [Archaeoglobus fulgidus DSM 4304]AAB89067.1 succinyl-CoA synthetase, alpha subunit (sucD-2) [Archaeoglobus fulgidus DSM 4304]AIG99173.1 succinyl-CoA synthetase, alpha subunit [Archaeoglobus fulgidus DSM 8774]
MAIIVDERTKVVVQGITGYQGKFHTERMLNYGTKIVAGVTPGKGGTEVLGVPVYDSVKEAVREADANASVIFVPAPFAADAVMEAADAGIKVIVCITEGIPVHDELKMYWRVKEAGATLIGPNCPGIISPGKTHLGIMPVQIFKPGNVGIVSRSGTLTYQIAYNLTKLGLGQSTVVGIGGDRIIGTDFVEVLRLFEDDKETKAVVLVGEIGGRDEEVAAEFIREMSKPVVGYVAGLTAPPGKRMGHAGAIIEGGVGTAESKIKALEAAGARVGKTPMEVAELVAEIL